MAGLATSPRSALFLATHRTGYANVLASYKAHVLGQSLSWPQLEQLTVLVHDTASQLPVEAKLDQWIQDQEEAMEDRLEQDDRFVPPPSFEEVQLMKQWLAIPRLNYDQVRSVATALRQPAIEAYATASVFLQFPQDAYGRLNGLAWVNVVRASSLALRAHALLSAYDTSHKGVLLENNIVDLVTDWAASVPWRTPLEETFRSYFVLIVARRLWLALAPHLTGKIVIERARQHPYCHALVDLQNSEYHSSNEYGANPLTLEAATKLHRQYLQLDTDKNGLLSKSEFLNYGRKKAFVSNDASRPTHELTRQFVDRVFEVVRTYDGELDYKSFLDLNLRIQDNASKGALQMYWRILDVHDHGYVDGSLVEYFLQGIATKVVAATGSALDSRVLRVLFDFDGFTNGLV
ncbi:hypothetical protein SPRG_05536 [Saprolegnia parasitica CBS 223.65]|uniref:Uncharacterized protein n=1 Tax=Saprolegnia parasitica (strain CBS 223.65) TaxID=695850 RepID=A0A067CK58_SAPPC|nr:hypothetical protein SPRG_05536 [Saprolegnia parasitica CBS 223.65]KDO29580.1 hypothetical protein SPRG_05536 [Saprolegnia parasitica CBS 223.65]|eukprot:XP_012199644.1 hypothetical protein SPRG_05536 [Saprolegnia parasitica CBS 223.65]